jgi:hypothetical protein
MSRGTAVGMAFVVVGGLGTAMMGRWDAFSIGFFFLFWGGLAAAITWIARGRRNADKHDALPIFNPHTEQPIDHPKINPATGLPMAGNSSYGVDVGGNTYGTTDASDAMASVHHPSSGAHVGL